MVVICEECGKKYRVDPANIKGKAASFKCQVCSHTIMVFKSQPTRSQPRTDSKTRTKPDTSLDDRTGGDGDDQIGGVSTVGQTNAGTRRHRKTGGFRLRAKMLLVFLLIPLMLTAGMTLFYLWHFETSFHRIAQESANIVSKLVDEENANVSAASAKMQSRAKAAIDRARITVLIVFGATLVLIGVIVFAYAYRLTEKIKSLTDVAERISAGELEREIETKSGDEIGELAEAIARMQTNIRLSVERLQREQ